MKKQIALMLCAALLLGGCAGGDSQEAAASAGSGPSSPAGGVSREAAPPVSSAASAPGAAAQPAPESSAVPPAEPEPEETASAAPVRVGAKLTVYYDGAPRFSLAMNVPADESYSGGVNAVRVDRKTQTGWETVRDDGTGSFTLEGKLSVNGPLPKSIAADALEGTLYRVTATLQTGEGGAVTASCSFRAGESFAEDAPENLANPGAFITETQVSEEDGGQLPFTQTVTNASGQTVILTYDYQVLIQSGGSVWKQAPAAGSVPEGELVLLPGQSASLSGALPATASEAKKTGGYRIVRRARVANPREGQEQGIEFFTQLDGASLRETAVAVLEDALRDVELRLAQTSYLAGDVPLRADVENKSAEPIVVGKLRVYNVKDGENVLEREERVEIPAGAGRRVLDETLSLTPGEYNLELSAWTKTGDAQAPLSKNFTVERDKLKNAASAVTVAMKVEISGRTDDGLAVFTQTFTNNSGQTLLAGRAFRVERQAGGLWVPAEYPAGSEPAFQEDMVIIRPGDSASFQGALPFPARDLPDQYRITRTVMVENPTPAQENGLTLVYTVTKK